MMLNILLFSFLFDLYRKMVSPQTGDTQGGPPPPPPPPPLSDATDIESQRAASSWDVFTAKPRHQRNENKPMPLKRLRQ